MDDGANLCHKEGDVLGIVFYRVGKTVGKWQYPPANHQHAKDDPRPTQHDNDSKQQEDVALAYVVDQSVICGIWT